jgi:hypothetical protein
MPPNGVIEILNITTSYHFIIQPKPARKIGGREPKETAKTGNLQ